MTIEDDVPNVFACIFTFRGGYYVARSSTVTMAQGNTAWSTLTINDDVPNFFVPSLGGAKSSFECGTILKNFTTVLAKLCILKHLETHFFRDFTGVSSKII